MKEETAVVVKILSEDLSKRMGKVIKPYMGGEISRRIWKRFYQDTLYVWFVWNALLYKEGYLNKVEGAWVLVDIEIKDMFKSETYYSILEGLISPKALETPELITSQLKPRLDVLIL